MPKMRQKSEFFRPRPPAVRPSPKPGNMDRHPFDGSTGGTLRAHPRLSLGETHLWICVLTDSGATRHFLRVQVRTTDPGGLQKEGWPKAQATKRRSRSDKMTAVRAHLQNTLALDDTSRQVLKIKQLHRADQALLPRCKVALLGAVPCICCAPLLKTKRITIQNPCDYKGHTLMDMRTELKAAPHAGLGFHFLRVPVGSHRILEVLKGKEAQSTRSRSAIRSK